MEGEFSTEPAGVRRPLVVLVALYIIGTALGLVVDAPFGWLVVPAGLFLLAGGLVIRRDGSVVLLGLAWLLTAWLAADLYAHNPSSRQLGHQMAHRRETLDMIGVVNGDPEPPARRGRGSWNIPVRIEGIHRIQGWQRMSGQCVVRVSDRARPEFFYGERRWWRGVIERRPPRHAGPDRYQMRVAPQDTVLLASDCGWWFPAFCYRMRRHAAATLSAGIEDYPDVVGLLKALMLGYRGALPHALRNDFSVTGTLHIMAISGLHVGIAAALLTFLLNIVGVPRDRWFYFLAPLLLMYTVLTGMKVSAVRACLMALAFWLAPLLRRRPDGPSSLSLAALIMLIVLPGQLLDTGFVLSFTVVAGLMMYYPVFVGPFTRRLRRDAWAMGRESWLRATLRGASLYVTELAAASTAAWITSAPLTAYYFNLFSPIALIGNLLVVPVAFVVVFTGVLSIILGGSFPLSAEICNHANRVFIEGLLYAIHYMGRLDWGHICVRSPPLMLIAWWYAVLAGLRWGKRWGRLAGVTLALAGLLWMGGQWLVEREVMIDCLDVGHGDATLVRIPHGARVMIDVGPARSSGRLLRDLRRMGVNRLDTVILTHPDARHVGAMKQLLGALPVGRLLVSPYAGRSRVYRAILERVRKQGIPIEEVTAGYREHLGAGVELHVLHPFAEKKYHRAGDASLVLRLAREDASILFMGGAGKQVEQALAKRGDDVGADILMVGDHGAPGVCGTNWLARVHPELAVISVGHDNHDSLPEAAVLERLAARGISIWRTDENGGLHIVWHGRQRGWKIGDAAF